MINLVADTMSEEDQIRDLYQEKNKFQTALQIVGQEERETVLVEALAFFINPYMKNGMTAESLKKFSKYCFFLYLRQI